MAKTNSKTKLTMNEKTAATSAASLAALGTSLVEAQGLIRRKAIAKARSVLYFIDVQYKQALQRGEEWAATLQPSWSPLAEAIANWKSGAHAYTRIELLDQLDVMANRVFDMVEGLKARPAAKTKIVKRKDAAEAREDAEALASLVEDLYGFIEDGESSGNKQVRATVQELRELVPSIVRAKYSYSAELAIQWAQINGLINTWFDAAPHDEHPRLLLVEALDVLEALLDEELSPASKFMSHTIKEGQKKQLAGSLADRLGLLEQGKPLWSTAPEEAAHDAWIEANRDFVTVEELEVIRFNTNDFEYTVEARASGINGEPEYVVIVFDSDELVRTSFRARNLNDMELKLKEYFRREAAEAELKAQFKADARKAEKASAAKGRKPVAATAKKTKSKK